MEEVPEDAVVMLPSSSSSSSSKLLLRSFSTASSSSSSSSTLRRFSTTALPSPFARTTSYATPTKPHHDPPQADLSTPVKPDRFSTLGEAKLSLVRNRSASLMTDQRFSEQMALSATRRRSSLLGITALVATPTPTTSACQSPPPPPPPPVIAVLTPTPPPLLLLHSRQLKLKHDRVRKCLDSAHELKLLALEDLGLGTDNELRRVAWGTLLSVHRRRTSSTYSLPEMPPNRDLAKLSTDHHQIALDCNRKFQGDGTRPATPGEVRRRARLEAFLHAFFDANVDLFYYQGFHDLCGALLLTIDDNNATNDEGEDASDELVTKFLVEKIARSTLVRDAARETMDAVFVQLQVVHYIIDAFDGELGRRIELALHGRDSIWAVSLLTCLFAHDVPNAAAFNRIMDSILGSPSSAFPLYLIAAAAVLTELPPQHAHHQQQHYASSDEELDVLGALKNSMHGIDVADADRLVRTARVIEARVPVSRVMEHACYKLKLPADSFLRQRFVLRSANPFLFSLATREKEPAQD